MNISIDGEAGHPKRTIFPSDRFGSMQTYFPCATPPPPWQPLHLFRENQYNHFIWSGSEADQKYIFGIELETRVVIRFDFVERRIDVDSDTSDASLSCVLFEVLAIQPHSFRI